MLNNCFYFGNYTPNGWASIIKKSEYCDYKKVSLCEYPNCVKQQVFNRIKSTLNNRKIPYTDLTIANGSMGIMCDKLRFLIVDGELVHINDSVKINLFDYADRLIYSENECRIKHLLVEKKRTEMRCERYLKACKSISDDIKRLDSSNVDFAKLSRLSSKLWKKYGGKPLGKIGMREKRFVTAFTKDGVELNMSAFDKMCDNIIVVTDKTGVCSSEIVDKICSYAISNGYDAITCICPVNLEVEHIIIPELKFGVFSSRYYHRADFCNAEKIYASRLHNKTYEKYTQRIDFSLRTFKSLMKEVFECVGIIDEVDNELNAILKCGFNRSELSKLIDELIL